MTDFSNPTIPPPTWSFDDIPIRPGNTSPEAASPPPDPACRDGTRTPPRGPLAQLFIHREKSSNEAPPLDPTEPASAFDFDTTQAASDEAAHDQAEHAEHAEAADAAPEQPDSRRYKIRTCRICFDEVAPAFEPETATAQFLRQRPRVVYVSDDPDCGRLMRPCKCKGTQKYVHEGCLKAWRMAAGADRNLWKCPTCLYEYKLSRLSWGSWVSSTAVRVAITLLIMILSVFLLGFIADPVIRYLNPAWLLGTFDEFEELEDWIPDGQPDTWSWHFTRGFFALGIMGMFKTVLFMRPWNNIRIGGGGRRRGGGRDRIDNIQWAMVAVGVLMFLRAVWKAVSAMTTRALTRFSDQIVDVPGADDEDGEEDAAPTAAQPQPDATPIPESRKDR